MKLRMATPDDLPEICMMGKVMHDESSYRTMNYDVNRVKETLCDLMDKSQFVVVVEDTNGAIVGGMAGMVTQSWFGEDSVANDLALFIHPAHRGGMVVVRLIKAFVQWARLAGAKQIRPGVVTGSSTAEALYQRLGFTKTGATFCMEGV